MRGGLFSILRILRALPRFTSPAALPDFAPNAPERDRAPDGPDQPDDARSRLIHRLVAPGLLVGELARLRAPRRRELPSP